MSSHKSDLIIDNLFTQALQPFSSTTPPKDAANKLLHRIQAFPPRVHKLFTWIHCFSALHFLLSNQPYSIEPYGQYRPSPFLSVTVSQLSGLRIAF